LGRDGKQAFRAIDQIVPSTTQDAAAGYCSEKMESAVANRRATLPQGRRKRPSEKGPLCSDYRPDEHVNPSFKKFCTQGYAPAADDASRRPIQLIQHPTLIFLRIFKGLVFDARIGALPLGAFTEIGPLADSHIDRPDCKTLRAEGVAWVEPPFFFLFFFFCFFFSIFFFIFFFYIFFFFLLHSHHQGQGVKAGMLSRRTKLNRDTYWESAYC